MLGNKEIMAANIRFYMNKYNKTRNEVCKDLGFAYSTFTDWINGNKYPRIDKIELMANYFHISKADLVEARSAEKESYSRRIPVYGRVAAGIPMDAIENIIDFEEIPADWQGEFGCYEVKGDSMSPRIQDGDRVIVKRQDDAESGDIVVAIVNGHEATVKKLIKHKDGITLQPFNPAYEPLYFTRESIHDTPVTIWGKVVENRSKF